MATSTGGMLLGHDLSTVLQCEKRGVRYYDFGSSEIKPPEQIVAAHGANLVRLRLWVNPPAGFSDYASVLEMAKRAKRANLKVLLCLHLSDYWADPGKQFTPGAWANQDFNTLCKTVEDYVRFIVEALQSQGTPPFIVAVGNEVSNGVLWPTGALSNPSQFTSLLKSGLAVVQSKGIATMVHINNGHDKGLVTWFMDLMAANRVSFDYLGLSFYPGDGAALSDLKTTLATAASRYNKPMVVVEVSHNWTPPPNGPDTQESSLRELLQVVSAVPKGLGAGVCYWESAWVAPGEAYPGEGNHYWNRALWNDRGKPLPALRCYEPYAKGPVQPVMQSRHHFWGNKHDEL
jgi:arabinogalactan endo-1,4-beta-galactosidase